MVAEDASDNLQASPVELTLLTLSPGQGNSFIAPISSGSPSLIIDIYDTANFLDIQNNDGAVDLRYAFKPENILTAGIRVPFGETKRVDLQHNRQQVWVQSEGAEITTGVWSRG